MDFIGAYSLLELANGQTIVAIGIAPNVVVSIGSMVSRMSLTAVPMMEGMHRSSSVGTGWTLSTH